MALENYTCKKNGLKFFVNKSYFSAIDTADKAYWLGFVTGDGHVRPDGDGLVISLQIGDISHLHCFASTIGYPLEAVTTYTSKSNGKSYCIFRVSGKTMRDDLELLGLSNTKHIYQPIPVIDKRLYCHFIRGFFDADGCISSSKRKNSTSVKASAEITGSNKILLDIYECLLDLGFTSNFSFRPTKKVFRLRFNSNAALREFYDFLYKDANICLNRKRFKYVSVLNELPLAV